MLMSSYQSGWLEKLCLDVEFIVFCVNQSNDKPSISLLKRNDKIKLQTDDVYYKSKKILKVIKTQT